MARLDLAQLRTVLLVRLSSIGDILLTTPVLRLLRQACPQARLDFALKAPYADLLRANPCVDRLLLVPPGESLRAMWRRLRQQRYDLVLDWQRTLRSRVLLWGVRATHRLAYNKRTVRRALLVHLGWNLLRPPLAVPELYARPLRRLGLTAPLPPLEMHLTPESQAAAAAYLEQALPAGQRQPLLAVAPGARWATKRWPAERFAAVAQALADAHGAAVVLLGDADDVPLAQAICQQLRAPVLDGTGRLSLMQTAALLQRCRLLLSNDSGLMHLAAALRVPVVAVFGPTVAEFGFYPFQATAQVVSLALPCRPCSTKGSRRCPRQHHQCMRGLSSEQVLDAARQLWPAAHP
ncbi:MAG: glycosyl hydrolase [Candidatus Tectimicrobiota bacterium]|nr:MAG: glycosyl hydrolase [Candidatus Tectomicrobia bacterium]